jgi:segregation and condensation protein B
MSEENVTEHVQEPAEESRSEVEPTPDQQEHRAERAATALERTEDVKPRLDGEQLKGIVEALVFASPEPLTPKMLFKLLNDEPREDVLAAIKSLQQDYEQRGGLHLVEVAGGYQITTRPELHDWVRRLFQERTTQKLSVQSLETLAVIAYKQPITAAEIGEIRGVNTSGVLSTLMERHLIKIVGRKNVIGRPFLYGTTKEFLIRFGLKDLNDLPRVEDMAAALGFDAPAVLMERPVTEEMLPLDEEPEDNEAEDNEPPDASGS